jgi:hypothetical protein
MFDDGDTKRVIAVAEKLELKMPAFSMKANQTDETSPFAKFVGIWTSNRGWSNGKGRTGMLIITDASSTGWISGHWLWGPPTKLSWGRSAPGSNPVFEQVVGDSFTMKMGNIISVKLNKNNTMSLVSTKEGSPNQTSRIEFHPIWQLVTVRTTPDPDHDRSAPPTSRKEKRAERSPERSITTPRQAEGNEPSGDETRCNRMHDKLACLCAVRNGGGIKADGKGWYSKRGGASAPTNEAFVQCQIRAGR